jgi:hypothetical protein
MNLDVSNYSIILRKSVISLKRPILNFDNKLIDIEHLYCLAHARAKFKYAYEQRFRLTFFFLYMISRLYRLKKIWQTGMK